MTPHTSDVPGAGMDGEAKPVDLDAGDKIEISNLIEITSNVISAVALTPEPLLVDVPDPEARARELEFSLFYADQVAKLAAFLVVQGASAELAADLAQEAMFEAYRKWDRIDTPRAWVRRVAGRAWWKTRDEEARESAHEEVPEPRMSELLSTEAAEEVEARHDFLTAVRTLPERQRQVLAWTYDGFTPQDIAEQLRMNPATVRSTLRNARTALQAALQVLSSTRRETR